MNRTSDIEALLDQSSWQHERRKLRSLLLDSGLSEGVKWGKLCYALQGSNVAIIYGMKRYCAIGFFKGALLDDPDHLLVSPGAQSQAMRQLRFATLAEIELHEPAIRSTIGKAIDAEKAGLEVAFDAKNNLDLPAELQAAFDTDPDFAAAFDGLTPGRQRGHVLHFSAAKLTATRAKRIAASRHKIMQGKGWNER